MPPTQVQGVLEYELGAPLNDVFEWDRPADSTGFCIHFPGQQVLLHFIPQSRALY